MTTRVERVTEWCDFATNGDVGRKVDDPVYQWIVEGRDPGPVFSSCGSLGHWLLGVEGCRESWINRDDFGGGYRIGQNVSLLFARAEPIATTFDALSTLTVGDILITWRRPDTTDAHVSVFRGTSGTKPTDSRLLTWDAGQGPTSRDAWRARRDYAETMRKSRPIASLGKARVLRLDTVTFAEPPLLPSGEAFDAAENWTKP